MQDVDFLCKGRCRLLSQTDASTFLPETLASQRSSAEIELADPAPGKPKSTGLRRQAWLSSGDPQGDLDLGVPEFHDPNGEQLSSAPVAGSLAIDLQYREGSLTLNRADCHLEGVDLNASGRAVRTSRST